MVWTSLKLLELLDAFVWDQLGSDQLNLKQSRSEAFLAVSYRLEAAAAAGWALVGDDLEQDGSLRIHLTEVPGHFTIQLPGRGRGQLTHQNLDDLFWVQTPHRASVHLHQQIARTEKAWEPQTTVSLSPTFPRCHGDGGGLTAALGQASVDDPGDEDLPRLLVLSDGGSLETDGGRSKCEGQGSGRRSQGGGVRPAPPDQHQTADQRRSNWEQLGGAAFTCLHLGGFSFLRPQMEPV